MKLCVGLSVYSSVKAFARQQTSTTAIGKEQECMSSDRKTIQSILSGDERQFERIIRDYKKLVIHIVSRLISNPSTREEICQDVFVKVFKNLASFEFNSKLSTWIARIAHNTTLSHLEKKKVSLYEDSNLESDEGVSYEQTISEDLWGNHLTPDVLLEQKDLRDLMQKEILSLPDVYRTILGLFHVDEMTYEEISTTMGLPEGTVKSYIFRARKMLKDRLIRKFQDEELRA